MGRYYNDFSDIDDSQDSLEHYGVPGMEWGKHLFGLAEAAGSHIKSTGQTFAAVGKASASMAAHKAKYGIQGAQRKMRTQNHTISRFNPNNAQFRSFTNEARYGAAHRVAQAKRAASSRAMHRGQDAYQSEFNWQATHNPNGKMSDWRMYAKSARNKAHDAEEKYQRSLSLRDLVRGKGTYTGSDRQKKTIGKDFNRANDEKYVNNLVNSILSKKKQDGEKSIHTVDAYTKELLKKNGKKLKKQGW